MLTAVLRRSEVLGEFTLGADRHGAPVEMGAVLDGMVRWWDARTMQTRLDCAMAQRNGDAGAEHCAAAAPGAFPYAFCYTVDDGRDQPRAKVSFHPIIDCHCFGLYTVILLSLLSISVKMTVPPRARLAGVRGGAHHGAVAGDPVALGRACLLFMAGVSCGITTWMLWLLVRTRKNFNSSKINAQVASVLYCRRLQGRRSGCERGGGGPLLLASSVDQVFQQLVGALLLEKCSFENIGDDREVPDIFLPILGGRVHGRNL